MVVSMGMTMVALFECELAPVAANPTPSPVRRVLPHPQLAGGAALTAVIASRRSARTYGARAIDDRELAQLLWAAQGEVDGHRTVPSAGALYPLTVRVIDGDGIWRYVVADHALVREHAGDLRAAVAAASHDQEAVRTAPVLLLITAELAITARKYGARAERYATLEAGHAAQNVLLVATALDLRAVPVGAFADDALRREVGLAHDVTPLYLIPIGAPR